MKALSLIFTLVFLLSPLANSKSGGMYCDEMSKEDGENGLQCKERPCRLDGAPINWALRDCGFGSGTDDEVALQKTKCFKDAMTYIDKKSTNPCEMKRRFKKSFCQKYMKEFPKKYNSTSDCIFDKNIKPFYAGE